ncbi:prolyl oligopeptidase family serine peptidase, partial [Vibrio mediterranei]
SNIVLGAIALTLVSSPLHASWQKKTFTSDGFTLPYQLFTPIHEGKVPLVIHLHGSGEAGTDNLAQMYQGTNIGPQYFSNNENQSIQAAYIMAPQTPKPMRWASKSLEPYVYANTPSTESMTALLRLIDKMVAENAEIDPHRIYMTGLSRGGQGVWNAMIQRPDLFAAAVPIAGSADTAEAGRIANIPTWVFHGVDDGVTNVDYSRQIVDAVIRSGGSTANIRYTEIEGGQHDDSWLTAYGSSDLYLWLVNKRKSE